MLNVISVEKYAFIVEQTRALEAKKKELAERFRQELQPGGEAVAGYIHEVKLSQIPVRQGGLPSRSGRLHRSGCCTEIRSQGG